MSTDGLNSWTRGWNKLDIWFREWLVKNTIVPHKMLLSFLLGFIAARLPLSVDLVGQKRAAMVFWAAFGFLILVLFLVKPKPLNEIEFRRSRWGIFSMIVLGFGVGALSYRHRFWFAWLWFYFRKIDEPHEWLLVSLFLLGVILGFFVVRNWSKSQEEFVKSLTAVVAAAFLAGILGNVGQGRGLDTLNTFAYYALGFGLSGTINLIVFSLLVARYSDTQSITSRSVIDFLYGSDKAKAIDGYFLKNFEEDPNYAKVKLMGALKAYREIIQVEFAKKLTTRKLMCEVAAPTSPPVLPSPFSGSCSAPPFDYFELLSIKSKQPIVSPPVPDPSDTFEVVFRQLPEREPIHPEMIRVAISMKWQDNLEYLVAPGQYQKSFPYLGSVAGLALAVKQTIVMDRDRFKKFRGKDFVEGRTPNDVDQRRGLNKIDYLSYVAVPMSSSFGKQEETGLGILHVDTKLFACSKGYLQLISNKEGGDDCKQEIYRLERTRQQLDDFATYASNLYKEHDEYIATLEHFRDVIIPLLELYLKCRTGTP